MEVLGIDIGGSGIKGGLVDVGSGELVGERVRYKTPQPATPRAVISRLARLVRKLDYQGPIGVGFPAIILAGRTMSAANVSAKWIDFPAAARMREATGYPVTLVNDADAAGIAEMRFGAGRGREGVVMIVTLGTGIGSALFVDGRLVPNTELGHLHLPGHKEDAEEYASSRILEQHGLTWKVWGGRVNEYLRHVEALFSPNLFIVGGGVSKQHDKFFRYLKLRTPVVPAEMRNEAGIVGAALAAAG